MYYLKPSTSHEQSFENSTFFSDYVYKEPTRFSGRKKYMMRTESESALSVHFCHGCSQGKYAKEDEISILHFKNSYKNKTQLTFDDSMKIFTPYMINETRRLFE